MHLGRKDLLWKNKMKAIMFLIFPLMSQYLYVSLASQVSHYKLAFEQYQLALEKI